MDFPKSPRFRANRSHTGSIADTRYSDRPSRADWAAGRTLPVRMIEGSRRDSSSVAIPSHSMQLVRRDPQVAISRYNGPPQQIPLPRDEDHLIWEQDPDRGQRSSASDREYLMDEDLEGICRSEFEIIDDDPYPSAATLVGRPGHNSYLLHEGYVRSFAVDDSEDDDSEGSLGFIEIKHTRKYTPAVAAPPSSGQSRLDPDPQYDTYFESVEFRRRPARPREEEVIILGKGAREYNDKISRENHDRSSREYDDRIVRAYDDNGSGEYREMRSIAKMPEDYDDRSSRKYLGRSSKERDGGSSRGYNDRRPGDHNGSRSREYHDRRPESSRSRAERYRYR